MVLTLHEAFTKRTGRHLDVVIDRLPQDEKRPMKILALYQVLCLRETKVLSLGLPQLYCNYGHRRYITMASSSESYAEDAQSALTSYAPLLEDLVASLGHDLIVPWPLLVEEYDHNPFEGLSLNENNMDFCATSFSSLIASKYDTDLHRLRLHRHREYPGKQPDISVDNHDSTPFRNTLPKWGAVATFERNQDELLPLPLTILEMSRLLSTLMTHRGNTKTPRQYGHNPRKSETGKLPYERCLENQLGRAAQKKAAALVAAQLLRSHPEVR